MKKKTKKNVTVIVHRQQPVSLMERLLTRREQLFDLMLVGKARTADYVEHDILTRRIDEIEKKQI